MAAKKPKNAKKALSDIEFGQPNKRGVEEIFAPPKNKKTLLLPKSRRLHNTLLPEDCHYQPENLMKFFLLEDVMVSIFIILAYLLIDDGFGMLSLLCFFFPVPAKEQTKSHL